MPIPVQNVSFSSVAVCQGEGCTDRCNAIGDCVVTMGSTLGNEATAFFYLNEHGGDPDEWIATAMTEITVGSVLDHVCLGQFVSILTSEVGEEVLRSDDRGATRVVCGDAAIIAIFATNPPQAIDALDRTAIYMVGDNGYIYGSFDGLRTIEVLDAGVATTQDLTQVMVARDNPQVIYACGAANALVKSENGGLTWFPLTGPAAGDALTALDVVNQWQLLIGQDDGEIWETVDGGDNWGMQLELPGQPTTSTVAKIVHYEDSDVFFCAINETAAPNEFYVYRNVNGGASGLWQLVSDTGTLPWLDIALCNQNHAVLVGGDSANTGQLLLLE